MGRSELCAWLRANSSGIYRPAAEAADEIEHLAATAASHFEQAMLNGEKANELRSALQLVMDYPEVRMYLGSQVSNVADAALGAA